MIEDRYFAVSKTDYLHVTSNAMWKVGSIVCIGTSVENKPNMWMTASVEFEEVIVEDIPAFLTDGTVRKSTKEAFNKYFNKNFEALQKLRFHDGEYYIDKSESGTSMHFHAFFRNPSRHYRIDYYQYEECAEICIITENNIIYRRGCENRCRILSEGIFCQVFKLVLEFFYDGSAMPKNQVKLWETLDALSSPSVPDGPVLINDEYYYLRARDLMLKRKKEIKLRLLELDDIPSKRRELRAEMKGIDYCVSILDKNH